MMRSTVDAAVVVCSVPKTRWPGLGGLDRDRDGLEVAQLADQHDVGILAQRRAQRVLERVGVRAHLALVDQALLVRVHELDRILDRDDVILARPVDVVDHRAQRRRLARAGRTGDEHQPLVAAGRAAGCAGDSPSCSAVRILDGMTRKTAPGPLRSAKTLARKPRQAGESRTRSRCRAARRTPGGSARA